MVVNVSHFTDEENGFRECLWEFTQVRKWQQWSGVGLSEPGYALPLLL